MATASARPLIQDGFECREMNDAEFAQYEIDQMQAIADAQVQMERVALRQSAIAKLAVLGLTEGEVAAIIA